MYVFAKHIHALNLLIINIFDAVFGYRVHVCAKF